MQAAYPCIGTPGSGCRLGGPCVFWQQSTGGDTDAQLNQADGADILLPPIAGRVDIWFRCERDGDSRRAASSETFLQRREARGVPRLDTPSGSSLEDLAETVH